MAFLLARREPAAQRRLVKGRVGGLRSLLRFSVSAGPDATADGCRRAAGRGLARYRRAEGDSRRRCAALAGQLRPPGPGRDPRYAIFMLVARLGLRSAKVAHLESATSTGVPGRSPCAARPAAKTGCRCRCAVAPGAGRLPVAGTPGHAAAAGASWRPRRRCGRSRRAGQRVTHGPATVPGCPASARSGCATRWRPRCCAGERQSSRWPGAAASRPGHHRRLRQGRLRRPAPRCPALAGAAR